MRNFFSLPLIADPEHAYQARPFNLPKNPILSPSQGCDHRQYYSFRETGGSYATGLRIITPEVVKMYPPRKSEVIVNPEILRLVTAGTMGGKERA